MKNVLGSNARALKRASSFLKHLLDSESVLGLVVRPCLDLGEDEYEGSLILFIILIIIIFNKKKKSSYLIRVRLLYLKVCFCEASSATAPRLSRFALS